MADGFLMKQQANHDSLRLPTDRGFRFVMEI